MHTNPDETPIHRGYLNKEGKALVRRWQQRYFVLFLDRIDYWIDEKDFLESRKKKGSINLAGCSLATAEQHTKRINTFGIFHTHRRDFFLEAPNQISMMQWVEHIENILGVKEKGVCIDDFELLTVVGQGSYGKVKKRDTGKIYAMKVISKDVLKKTEAKSQSNFNRELSERKHLAGIINVEKAVYKHWLVQATKAERRVLEVVNHPFIVKLHFAFRTASQLCLVMDFINGGELFSHISKAKRFSEDRARFYTAEIILALEYLHEMDIIYRDLKPENILLDYAGHVRLTDFGHSKDEHSRESRSFSVVGSPYYMAPEILLNKGHGKEADWWSLGILTYEMMVGLPPFYRENTREAYEKLLSQPIEFPDYVSPAARSFLRELLQVDPKLRLGGADPPGDWQFGETHRIAHKWNVEWLKDVQWDRLLALEVEPPYKPKVKGIADVSTFSDSFTDTPIPKDLTLQTRGGMLSEVFAGFDYVAPICPAPSPKSSPHTLAVTCPAAAAALPSDPILYHIALPSSAHPAHADAPPPAAGGGEAARRFSAHGAGQGVVQAGDIKEQLDRLKFSKARRRGDGEAGLGLLVSEANELLEGFNWDFDAVVEAVGEALVHRQSVEACFQPKASQVAHMLDKGRRLLEFRDALDRYLATTLPDHPADAADSSAGTGSGGGPTRRNTQDMRGSRGSLEGRPGTPLSGGVTGGKEEVRPVRSGSFRDDAADVVRLAAAAQDKERSVLYVLRHHTRQPADSPALTNSRPAASLTQQPQSPLRVPTRPPPVAFGAASPLGALNPADGRDSPIGVTAEALPQPAAGKRELTKWSLGWKGRHYSLNDLSNWLADSDAGA